MTRYIDVFWEKLKQQTKKRRRAISIMLVLSLAVSSTVVWSLHGTGITMVNEELCGLELHSHTDECYSDVLVCGLDESDGHTHTAECYERQLTCTLPEHIHTSDCYIGMKPDQSAKSAEEPLGDAKAIGAEIVGDENIMKMSSETDNADGDEKLSDDEEIVDADLSEMGISPDTVQLLGETSTEPLAPLTGLPDTRKDGIVINLFDYDQTGSNGGLGVLDVPGNTKSRNLIFESINSGRTESNDILFQGQGINSGSGKNDFSGGHYPIQGIVNKKLENGYPTVAGSNKSLEYLFSPEPIDNGVKIVYSDVGNLLQKNEDGYYFYDSDKNYAYYNTDTSVNPDKNFIIYNKTFGIISDTHHDKGDPKIDGSGNYDSTKDPMRIGFFPFNDYNNTKTNPNVNYNSYYNHHFGMTLEATFEIPQSSTMQYQGKDVIFEYSGDDDMWIFVDGILVLDVGGIHRPAAGKINFSKDIIEFQTDLDKNNNIIWDSSGSLTKAYSAAGGKWEPEKEHHIQMFYLERGGCNSNLTMMFNLPTIQTIKVSKKVDKGTNYTSEYDNQTYSFQLYSKSDAASDDDELYTGSYEYKGNYIKLGDDGIFTVNPNESVSFHGLDKERYYYVKELEVDSSDYSDVLINGEDTELPWGSGIHEVSSSIHPLSECLNYDFVNKVGEETIDINVTKQWVETPSKNHSGDKVLFRIIRTDENNVKNYMVINKRKTFVLSDDNNWSMSIDNLVTRYGTHYYKYDVEEVSEFADYTKSVEKNTLSDGTVQYILKNVSTSKVEINVKKQWLDAFGNELEAHPSEITAKLERHYYEYGNPQRTSLNVKLLDTDGNVISDKTTSAAYIDGSIEFMPDVPESAVFVSASSDNCSISEADGVFEASAIKSDAVVELTFDNFSGVTEYAHSSFTSDLGGWTAKGVAKVQLGNTYGNSLLATNRSKDVSSGPKYVFASNLLKLNTSYGISVKACAYKVRHYSFVLNYRDKNNGEHNVTISEKDGIADKWIQLSDLDFTLPSDCDLSREISVYVRTNDGGDFYIDDFVVINGGYDTVDIDSNDNVIVSPTPEISFFEDTAIAEPVLTGQGDETVTPSFTLNSYNNWSKKWEKKDLNEISGRKYVYKVTEITNDPKYLVTYEDNNVSSNSEEHPIIIKNTENMYELPATGGIGTKRIVFGGTFLILISLLSGYCVAKRERRKE